MLKTRFLYLAFLSVLLVAACAPVTPTPALPTPFQPVPTDPEPVPGVAVVESVEFQLIENSPIQVNVIVRGQLPDAGCTTISSINQTREGNTFKVTLMTATDPLAVCPLVLTPFERLVALDVANLPAAEYLVDVNGITRSFKLLTRAPAKFKQDLVAALNARNYDLLKLMMDDSFMIGYWLSEGTTSTPDAALEQLKLNLLSSTSPITADYTRNLIELLGKDPVTIVGPDVIEASPLLVSGLGAEGKDQAILFTAKLPDGNLYWYGLLFAKDGFKKPDPIVITPVDTNAYPTHVKYVMAQLEVRLRSGPGTQFSIIGWLARGQTVRVIGVSADGNWWRVICPDNSAGICWVSAARNLTRPTDTPLPDPTAYPTDVKYVMALRDLTMYSGPSTQYSQIGFIAAGQIAQVTGINGDGKWWRVICPDSRVGSCWVSADPNHTRPTDLTANADVQSVEIQILESNPLQVNAIARGQLPDSGCTTISEVSQTRSGNTFNVTLRTKTNPQAVCAQVITPFEQVIPLDVSSLPPGRYIVRVNNVEVSFDLPAPVISGTADVQSLQVQILQSYPLQVNAIARGQLPDSGCTTISEISQTRSGNVFTVTVMTKTDPQAFCAPTLTPFEQVISLEVGSLLPGRYIVRVNGVETSFMLPEAQQPTSVQFVMAQRDVMIFNGPGTQYSVIGSVASGQTARVTGVSANGNWWRVICPDNSTGSCWVSANPADTLPTQ